MSLTPVRDRPVLVAAAAAVAVAVAAVLAVAAPADAVNSPAAQLADSGTPCVLQPDPDHPGQYLYPAVDDLAFIAANAETYVNVLNNDCVGSAADTRWAFTYTQPETQEDANSGATGRNLHPAGTVDVEPGSTELRYLPPVDFLGSIVFTYSWVESGTENGIGYTGRRSSTATVTIRIFPNSKPPTPPSTDPTSSAPVDTGTPTASPTSSAPVDTGTPAASPTSSSPVGTPTPSAVPTSPAPVDSGTPSAVPTNPALVDPGTPSASPSRAVGMPVGGISQSPQPITPVADVVTPALPVTGASPALGLGAGLTAVLGGAVLVLAGRRRRKVSPR